MPPPTTDPDRLHLADVGFLFQRAIQIALTRFTGQIKCRLPVEQLPTVLTEFCNRLDNTALTPPTPAEQEQLQIPFLDDTALIHTANQTAAANPLIIDQTSWTTRTARPIARLARTIALAALLCKAVRRTRKKAPAPAPFTTDTPRSLYFESAVIARDDILLHPALLNDLLNVPHPKVPTPDPRITAPERRILVAVIVGRTTPLTRKRYNPTPTPGALSAKQHRSSNRLRSAPPTSDARVARQPIPDTNTPSVVPPSASQPLPRTPRQAAIESRILVRKHFDEEDDSIAQSTRTSPPPKPFPTYAERVADITELDIRPTEHPETTVPVSSQTAQQRTFKMNVGTPPAAPIVSSVHTPSKPPLFGKSAVPSARPTTRPPAAPAHPFLHPPASRIPTPSAAAFGISASTPSILQSSPSMAPPSRSLATKSRPVVRTRETMITNAAPVQSHELKEQTKRNVFLSGSESVSSVSVPLLYVQPAMKENHSTNSSSDGDEVPTRIETDREGAEEKIAAKGSQIEKEKRDRLADLDPQEPTRDESMHHSREPRVRKQAQSRRAERGLVGGEVSSLVRQNPVQTPAREICGNEACIATHRVEYNLLIQSIREKITADLGSALLDDSLRFRAELRGLPPRRFSVAVSDLTLSFLQYAVKQLFHLNVPLTRIGLLYRDNQKTLILFEEDNEIQEMLRQARESIGDSIVLHVEVHGPEE